MDNILYYRLSQIRSRINAHSNIRVIANMIGTFREIFPEFDHDIQMHVCRMHTLNGDLEKAQTIMNTIYLAYIGQKLLKYRIMTGNNIGVDLGNLGNLPHDVRCTLALHL